MYTQHPIKNRVAMLDFLILQCDTLHLAMQCGSQHCIKADAASYFNVSQEDIMFGFGMPELIIILVIVLVVFGAGRLPEIGGALGKSIRNFKKASDGKDEIEITPKSEDNDKKA
jgi:sec-independent protein translocase protein TatA